MVIIKCNVVIPAEDFTKAWRGLVEMAASGENPFAALTKNTK